MKTARDILVIDDEEIVTLGVARICGGEGLSVDTADSGAAGLERLGAHTYRLVLCDIKMEVQDGFQFLAEARSRGHREPVIMTTGYATVENAVRSLQSGAIDYLPKPFTADELIAVVRRGMNVGRFLAGSDEALRDVRPCPPRYHRLGYVSWARSELEGTVRIGLNDLFVKTMSGMRSVELLSTGSDLALGASCATVTSEDGLAHAVMCPVSGRILETHDEAAADPAVIVRDPYEAGWLYRVLPSELEYDLRCLSMQEIFQTGNAHRSGERP